jgi:membrane-associated phospholipid phosphatase
VILALTASISRVIVHAHFSTDVAAGIFLGTGWAYACHVGFAAPVFDQLERTFEKRSISHGTVQQTLPSLD